MLMGVVHSSQKRGGEERCRGEERTEGGATLGGVQGLRWKPACLPFLRSMGERACPGRTGLKIWWWEGNGVCFCTS